MWQLLFSQQPGLSAVHFILLELFMHSELIKGFIQGPIYLQYKFIYFPSHHLQNVFALIFIPGRPLVDVLVS